MPRRSTSAGWFSVATHASGGSTRPYSAAKRCTDEPANMTPPTVRSKSRHFASKYAGMPGWRS
ncbi:MAG: hypothetical protein MUE42_15080, partial [Opitutaceae bacterium]|nr:hypothetical protein [Opitutaceae bacterium]